jgi:hypothetical protein
MKDLLIMSFLVISGGILLLTVTIMLLSGKVKIKHALTMYCLLILLPIIMMVVPTVLVSPNKGYSYENILFSIPRWIYSFEILLLLVIILIRVNILPGSSLENKKNVNSDLKKIASGIRLLQYSIFTNILYLIPILIMILYIIYFASQTPSYGNSIVDISASIFVWGTLLFPSLAQFYSIGGIFILFIITLAIIIFITSINGTIRITSVAVQNKKSRIMYIIFMWFPVINVLCMLFLCHLGKRKIKTGDISC